jgi:hypothetical protein
MDRSMQIQTMASDTQMSMLQLLAKPERHIGHHRFAEATPVSGLWPGRRRLEGGFVSPSFETSASRSPQDAGESLFSHGSSGGRRLRLEPWAAASGMSPFFETALIKLLHGAWMPGLRPAIVQSVWIVLCQSLERRAGLGSIQREKFLRLFDPTQGVAAD